MEGRNISNETKELKLMWFVNQENCCAVTKNYVGLALYWINWHQIALINFLEYDTKFIHVGILNLFIFSCLIFILTNSNILHKICYTVSL